MGNRCFLLAVIFSAALVLVTWRGRELVAVHAQQPPPQAQPVSATEAQPQTQGPVFKSQTKLVLVDSTVTDKKGNYIRDLTQKDFRVWEDNKEQEVKSFSYESDTSSPNSTAKHYLVLFFDNSTMDFADQARARDAASKFIDKNAGPNRLMALVDFGGALRITQNFTADTDRLKKIVAGTRFSNVSPNAQAPVEVASLGAPPLMNAEAEFGAHSMLMAVRELAKNL